MDGEQQSFDQVWERVSPWIAKALPYSGGTHELEDIKDGILSGQFHIWPTERAVLVTEIIQYPRCRDLNVFLIGGKLDQVLDMEPSIMDFAKALGCRQVTGAGRAGWVRVMKDHGWKEPFKVIAKEVV